MSLTLEQASTIVDVTLAKGREMKLPALCVAVLDAGGHLKALKREDRCGIIRPEIAMGKAWGVLGMGFESSRTIGKHLGERLGFLGALQGMCDGKMVPVAGGVAIYVGDEIVGAVGVTGATSDEDEQCALAGIAAAGLTARAAAAG